MPVLGKEHEVGVSLLSLVSSKITGNQTLAETGYKSKAFALYSTLPQPRGGIMMMAFSWVREFIIKSSDQDWSTGARFKQIESYVKRYHQLEQLQDEIERLLINCGGLKGRHPGVLKDSFLLAQMDRRDACYVNFLMQLTGVAFSYHVNSILFRVNAIVTSIDSVSDQRQCDVKNSFEHMIRRAKLAIIEQSNVRGRDGVNQSVLCFLEHSFRNLQVLSRCVRPFFAKPLSTKVLDQLGLYDFFDQILRGVPSVDFNPKCLVTSFSGAVREVLEYKKAVYKSEAQSSFCCLFFSSRQVGNKQKQIDYIDSLLDNFESELDVGEILSGQFNPKYVPAY